MATPANIFKEMVEDLEKTLKENPTLGKKFKEELGKAVDFILSPGGTCGRRKVDKNLCLQKVIFNLVNSNEELVAWLNRYIEDTDERLGFYSYVDSLVNSYSYRYFKTIVPTGKEEDVKEGIETPVSSSGAQQIQTPSLSPSDLDNIKSFIIDELWIHLFMQAYYTLTKDERVRRFMYFSDKAKSMERKYTKSGHYYNGYPLPYPLMTALKMGITQEKGSIAKSIWSPELTSFIERVLLSKKKIELKKDYRKNIDISQLSREINEKFYSLIDQQLKYLQNDFPNIPPQDFILLLTAMVIPSRRGPQASNKEYLQRKFSEKIKDADKLWQDYSSFTSDLEDEFLEKAQKSPENHCFKLLFVWINRWVIENKLPSGLYVEANKDNFRKAIDRFKILNKEQKEELKNMLANFAESLTEFIRSIYTESSELS